MMKFGERLFESPVTASISGFSSRVSGYPTRLKSRRAKYGLALVVLVLSCCEQTHFEERINIPSRFIFNDFLYIFPSPRQLQGNFDAGFTNNGTSCARVSGTIDWGDGVIETDLEIEPCVTLNNQVRSWRSERITHNYSGLGTYSFSATLTAHFTNGDISDSIKKTIVVNQ